MQSNHWPVDYLQNRKLTKGLTKVISLCKATKVPAGLGPGASLQLSLEDMENKEPALIFTQEPFLFQEWQLGQGEAEAPLGLSNEQDPLGWASSCHPIPSHPHQCIQSWHAANPPGWAGGTAFLWCVRGNAHSFISQQALLSSVVITCLLQHVKIEMYGCGNPSLKTWPVLLREWLHRQANPHHTFLHDFHHL